MLILMMAQNALLVSPLVTAAFSFKNTTCQGKGKENTKTTYGEATEKAGRRQGESTEKKAYSLVPHAYFHVCRASLSSHIQIWTNQMSGLPMISLDEKIEFLESVVIPSFDESREFESEKQRKHSKVRNIWLLRRQKSWYICSILFLLWRRLT